MKKVLFPLLAALLLLSSCYSYTASGAYTGSTLGSVLGSAIGGITNGPRGSDWGQIIGMAGGAIIGGAIGNAADKAEEQKVREHREAVAARSAQRRQDDSYGYQDYGTRQNDRYEPSANGADDRIELNIGGAPTGGGHAVPAHLNGRQLAISNVSVIGGDGQGVLRRGQTCRIAFDLTNVSSRAVYNVQPCVVETTGNRNVRVSPSIRVESIAPGSGVRYTATVEGSRSLRNGVAVLELSAQADNGVRSRVETVKVTTSRR